jgi:hypothetical protein
MFQNIPKTRLLLYFLVGGLLPILFVAIHFLSLQSSLDDLQMTLMEMQRTAALQEKKQAANIAVINHYEEADHFYIDKALETLTFLEPEIEGLQKLLTNKHLADDEAVRKRLEYLTGSPNDIVFAEGVVQSTPLFQETTETLVHPVEINQVDLQKILAKIEGIPIGPYLPSPNRPQLIVLDFKLDRKYIHDKNEVFVLNLKLLKREFQ